MAYVTAVFVYLHLWATGAAALRTEAMQRPEIQCSAEYVAMRDGPRPVWCPAEAPR